MRAFVMMPFGEMFQPVRSVIRQAAATSGVHCIWADELAQPGRISDQIVSEIRRSVACIADVTHHNPNVAWEIGFAQALRKDVIMIARSGTDLPFDLKDLRTIFYDPCDLHVTLGQRLVTWLTDLRERHCIVPPEDLAGTVDHEDTSLVLAAKRIADTKYGFFDLITDARNHIFLAAQTHYFFFERKSRKRDFLKAILTFIGRDADHHVDIMLCDPSCKYAVKAWTYVTGERYQRDLVAAEASFAELRSLAHEQPHLSDRLSIRYVPFVPLSITFVDPSSPDGFLVLTPNAYEERAIVRPCFVISRARNPEIFTQYWSTYYRRFNDFPD